MFHSFLSDDIKQDAPTTFAHSKIIIILLKQRTIMSDTLITIWENRDVCAEHYRFATALYPMSMLSQTFSVTIHRGISAPGHVREVLYFLNSIEKSFNLQLMSTVQLTG